MDLTLKDEGLTDMTYILTEKFLQNLPLVRMLKSTSPKTLAEVT